MNRCKMIAENNDSTPFIQTRKHLAFIFIGNEYSWYSLLHQLEKKNGHIGANLDVKMA